MDERVLTPPLVLLARKALFSVGSEKFWGDEKLESECWCEPSSSSGLPEPGANSTYLELTTEHHKSGPEPWQGSSRLIWVNEKAGWVLKLESAVVQSHLSAGFTLQSCPSGTPGSNSSDSVLAEAPGIHVLLHLTRGHVTASNVRAGNTGSPLPLFSESCSFSD